jgi:hypothetical protein
MEQETPGLEKHLTDAELFALAAPATGEPEALPRHLSHCRACSRAVQDWKAAMRELADDETGELARRTPEQWRAAEDATLAAIPRAAPAGRRFHAWRWALAAAASLLLAVLLLPGRRGPSVASVAPTPATAPAASSAGSSGSELGAQDQADDELLRQASFLAAGGDVDTEPSGSADGRL